MIRIIRIKEDKRDRDGKRNNFDAILLSDIIRPELMPKTIAALIFVATSFVLLSFSVIIISTILIRFALTRFT